MIARTERTESQDRRSSVRGREHSSVGMAKMPVYSIRHSLFDESVPSAI